MNKKVINNFGEIIANETSGDTVKVLTWEQKQYLERTIELNKDEKFVKIFTNSIDTLTSKKLSGTELNVCLKLLGYIRYETGILAFDNGNRLTNASICTITGFNCKTIQRVLSSLISKHIFGKAKVGRVQYILVNPYIFMKGVRVNKTLLTLFSSSEWARLYGKENSHGNRNDSN